MIKSVGIVGAGTMGRGIAQLCAQRGFSIRIFDAFPDALPAARRAMEAGLVAGVKKGKLTPEQAQASSARVTEARHLRELQGSGLVIEAISEDIELKRELFRKLDALSNPEVILATNTSSLLVRDIAQATSHPERVLGLHFFNPPAAMKLVEAVRTPHVSEARFREAWSFILELGKTPVAAQDTPGFIVNRIMRPFYLEALRLAGQGQGDCASIDAAVKSQGGVPMGPFELMDLIGLDVNLTISRSIYQALGRPERLRPHSIQERLVQAGSNGRKSGKGFYTYHEGRPGGSNPEALRLLPAAQTSAQPNLLWLRIMEAIAGEAERAAGEGVASEADIDAAIKMAMNFPRGPFEWRREHAQKA